MFRLALLAALLGAKVASAQVAEVDVRTGLFLEPSDKSHMRVITPSVSASATPFEFVTLEAGWSADVVSGASESVKAGKTFSATPDVVTSASVVDHRQLLTGGVAFHKEHTTFGASYSHGSENDYRSNTVTAIATSDFFQRNTRIEVAFSHGFDDVCDLSANANQAPTVRRALDESKGCFSKDTRRTVDITTDNFQGAWTQSFTPVFATQLVLTGAIQHGFLSNPYRSVVVGPSGETAQEHHPRNRARAAAALRAKYYVRPLDAAIGAGVRVYRDTWDILSETFELDVEKGLGPWLRLGVQGRYYDQGEAVFWSDDYTGGEPHDGPRGEYFSGDREVSPMKSLLVGARATASFHGRPGARVIGLFVDFDASVGASILETSLDDFTWAGKQADDTTAYMLGGNLTAVF